MSIIFECLEPFTSQPSALQKNHNNCDDKCLKGPVEVSYLTVSEDNCILQTKTLLFTLW